VAAAQRISVRPLKRRSFSYGAAALLLGVAGAGIGALVAPGEKWESVTGDRLRVAVSPARGGARVAVSLNF
jgi:hypothetical protein